MEKDIVVKHSPKITKGNKQWRNRKVTFWIPLNISHAVIAYAVILRWTRCSAVIALLCPRSTQPPISMSFEMKGGDLGWGAQNNCWDIQLLWLQLLPPLSPLWLLQWCDPQSRDVPNDILWQDLHDDDKTCMQSSYWELILENGQWPRCWITDGLCALPGYGWTGIHGFEYFSLLIRIVPFSAYKLIRQDTAVLHQAIIV
jgi:hypothetical protein